MGRLCCYATVSFHDMQMFFKSVKLSDDEKATIDLEADESALWRIDSNVKLLFLKNITSTDYIKIVKRISDIYKVRNPFIIVTQCDVNVLKHMLQYPNLINVLSRNTSFEQDINDFLRDQLAISEESYEF